MNVAELIAELNKIEDKEATVWVSEIWADSASIEVIDFSTNSDGRFLIQSVKNN